MNLNTEQSRYQQFRIVYALRSGGVELIDDLQKLEAAIRQHVADFDGQNSGNWASDALITVRRLPSYSLIRLGLTNCTHSILVQLALTQMKAECELDDNAYDWALCVWLLTEISILRTAISDEVVQIVSVPLSINATYEERADILHRSFVKSGLPLLAVPFLWESVRRSPDDVRLRNDLLRAQIDAFRREPTLTSEQLHVQPSSSDVLAKLESVETSLLPPVLPQAVASDDVMCRRFAAEAIVHIGSVASSLLSIVLRDSDEMVRNFGLEAAKSMGPSAAPSIADLIAILRRKERAEADTIPQIHQRRKACDALRAIGPDARDAIQYLLSAIVNCDQPDEEEIARTYDYKTMLLWLQLQAAHAHFVISGDGEPCVGIAAWMLDYVKMTNRLEIDASGYPSMTEDGIDTGAELRVYACDVLTEIGSHAQGAVARLKNCFNEDQNEAVRTAAEKALVAIYCSSRKWDSEENEVERPTALAIDDSDQVVRKASGKAFLSIAEDEDEDEEWDELDQ